MSETKPQKDLLEEQSERTFRKECDDNGYPYMSIDQNPSTFSSSIWESKRPDYLVSIPSVGSILVDVKAYKKDLFYEKAHKELNKIIPEAFHIDFEELSKFEALQKITSMKVWFAFIPVQNEALTEGLFFIPVDRVFEFVKERHRKWESWSYVKIPKNCCSKGINATVNICSTCTIKYCKGLDELLKIEDKIAGTIGLTKCSECHQDLPMKKK